MCRIPQLRTTASWLLPALVALAADIGSALACTCIPVSLGDRVRDAPAIFVGQVTAVRYPAAPDNPGGLGTPQGDRLVGSASSAGGGGVAVTVEVLDRWKGDVPARAALHSMDSGSACGVFGRPPPIGQRVLALAFPLGDPGSFAVNACSGAVYRLPDELPAPLAQLGAERERFEAAVATSPGSLAPLFERARFRERWNPAGAVAEYRQIARDFPDLPAAHLGTGRALLAAGRVKEALTPLRHTLELAPADVEAAGLVGQARLHLGESTVLATLRYFQGFEGRDLDLGGRELRGATLAGARIQVLRTPVVPASVVTRDTAPGSPEYRPSRRGPCWRGHHRGRLPSGKAG